MSLRRLLVPVAAALLAAPDAGAAPPRLSAAYAVGPGGALYAGGVASGAGRGARVQLQSRATGRPRTRAIARVRRGRFQLTWRHPSSAASVQVRAVLKSRGGRTLRTGRWKTIALAGAPAAPPVAGVSAKDVSAAPLAGQPGAVSVTGTANVAVGEILALGVGPATPYGLLARVAAVTEAPGGSVLDTVPATLPEVLPAGTLDLQTPVVGLPRSATKNALPKTPDKTRAVTCTSGQTMTASASIGFESSASLQAAWHWTSGVNARFEGKLAADAHLAASITGSASCDLPASALFERPLPLGTYVFQLGPVPVVVHPQLQVTLTAHGQVQAQLAASVDASFRARAGVQFGSGGFAPFGEATPTLKHDPPKLTATGSASATLGPELDVLIQGVRGPSVDLKAGLALAADSTQSPWWTLTAPLDLGATLRLSIWKIGVESERLGIWSATPKLAISGGPAGPTPEPTTAATPPNCGTVTDPANGETYALRVTSASSCAGAADVMLEYWRQAAAGGCEGHGNTCFLEVGSATCLSPTAASSDESGVKSVCHDGDRTIQAVRPT